MKSKLGNLEYFSFTLAMGLLLGASTSTYAAELRIGGVGGAAQAAATESMVKPYAAKTGTNVIEDEYDQKLAEIRAQVEAKSLKWDVIMVGPSVGPLACDEGLLEDRLRQKGVMDQADFSKPLDALPGADVLVVGRARL